MGMTIAVTETDLTVLNAERRMSFHFGNVHIEAGPQLLLAADVDVDGTVEQGVASGTFTPMWFYKEPSMSLAESCDELLAATEAAANEAVETEATTVFDFWRSVHAGVERWADGRANQPPLLWNYAVSLVEQAVVDAFCRATDTPFAEAVRENALGLDLGWWYDELAGTEPGELLPDEPLEEAAIRHTVGLSDPLTPEDVPDDERLRDGLPQALSEYVDQQGISHFKVKLAAEPSDADRLRRIAAVLDSRLGDYAVSLDANEQYDDVSQFREQWRRFRDDEALSGLLDNLLYVEQPLARDVALSDATRRGFADWDDRPPVIIDESDDRPRTCKQAIDCGYAGTSHKNCKGVLKGIANRCLVEQYDRQRDRAYVMSGEDLSVVPPVELQQDFAVTATLGLYSVERNGHHYYRGLSMLPEDVQTAVLDAHPDLFERREEGFVALDVTDGRVALGSVVDAPFGRGNEFDPSRFTPAEEWEVSSIAE